MGEVGQRILELVTSDNPDLRHWITPEKQQHIIDPSKLTLAGPPALTEWPPGFINDFIQWAAGGTDCPDEFLFNAALQSLATAAAHSSLYMRYGGNRLYSNVWQLMIASSSFFRKSTAMARSKEVLQAACPNKIMADRLTPESFYEGLVGNPEGLFVISEFGALLGSFGRSYMAGFQGDLTELFDCPSRFVRQRKGRKGDVVKFEVERPIISIYGGSTIDWLAELLKESDAGSGFLPRFLFSVVTERRKPVLVVPGIIDPTPDKLVNALRHVAGVEGEIKFGEGSPGYDIYHSFFNFLMNEMDECKEGKAVMAGFISRLQIYALKIAIALEAAAAAYRGEYYIKAFSVDSIAWATVLVRWYYFNLRWLLSNELTFGEHERQRNKVVKYLREAGGELPHSRLLKVMKMSQKQFVDLMDTLVESKDIVEEDVPPKKTGRPGKKYLLAEVLKTDAGGAVVKQASTHPDGFDVIR